MKKISLVVLIILTNCTIVKEEIRLGANWKKIESANTFPARRNFGTAVIDGKIIVIGGYVKKGSREELVNDVWKSSDLGKTWIEVVKNIHFTLRYRHKVVAIGTEIYVIGGFDGRQYFNEIWKSKDLGKNWSRVTSIPFKERQGFGAINYKGEILLIGG